MWHQATAQMTFFPAGGSKSALVIDLKMAHGLEMLILAENTSFSGFVVRAQNITTTAHFVGSGRFQAVTPSGEHALHAPNVRSDIRSGPWHTLNNTRTTGGGVRRRSPRSRSKKSKSVNVCYGPDRMSDRTSGAWSVYSLDGPRARNRPEPTK